MNYPAGSPKRAKMSKQPESVGYCALEIQTKEHFLKCSMKEHWGMKEGRVWEFYIPRGIDKLDLCRIVNFRMKHDFNVVVKGFSVCFIPDKINSVAFAAGLK